MLPHFTKEAYSWADPEERIFGFKSGQKNQTFVSWVTFLQVFPQTNQCESMTLMMDMTVGHTLTIIGPCLCTHPSNPWGPCSQNSPSGNIPTVDHQDKRMQDLCEDDGTNRNHDEIAAILRIEESDSDAGKTFIQTRHTQTTFSSLEQKKYRQDDTYKCSPDDSQF